MKFIKKIILIIFNTLIKIVNIIGILAVIIFALLLYIVIFEVPVNFFNKYIEEKIFHNLVKIDKVYLKWDYNVKKPVIILDNIQYNDANNKISFTFKHLGVTFDITKLIFHHKFYPIYVNLEGFKLAGIRYKDNTLAFNLQSTTNIPLTEVLHNVANNKLSTKNIKENTDKSITVANNLPSKYNLSDIEKEGIYNLIRRVKQEYTFLSLLNRIDINNSTINFTDEVKNKDFLIDFNHISIIHTFASQKILIKSNASIEDMGLHKTIYIKGESVADKQKNLFFNYNIENISPEFLLTYSSPEIKNKIKTAGLFINANIDGRYVFSSGIQAITTDINVEEGEIFIKDILLDKLKINSLKTQVIYNSTYNKVNIPSFKVNVSSNTPLKLKVFKGGDINVKSITGDANLDLKKVVYNINNIKIDVADQIVGGKISYNQGNMNFDVSTVNPINVTEIKKLWSQSLLYKVRSWVITNITQGVITKAQLAGSIYIGKDVVNLKNLKGSALVNNAEVRYLNGMPKVFAPKVKLEFDQKHLNIKYFEARTGNLFSKSGEVILMDEFPYKQGFYPVLKIDAQAEGKVVDGLSYINNKPMYLLKKSHLDPSRFDGDVAGNIYLEYSFDSEVVQNININLVGHNVSFKNAFKDKDITKSNLNLTVKDTSLLAYGNGEYYNMPVNLYINVDWNKEIPYALKLNVELKDVSYSKINDLNLLPEILHNKLDGTVSLSTEIQQLKSSNQKLVTASLDLTNTFISNLPYLDYVKPKQVPATALINLNFIDEKLLEIKQFTLKSNDLFTQLKIAFTEDKSTNIVIDKFIMKNIADVKGYLYLKDHNFYMNLGGNYLNVEWLYKGYQKETKLAPPEENTNKLNNKPTEKPQTINNSYVVKINMKKAESNGVILNNFYVNCDLINKDLNALVVSGELNKNDNITVVYDKPSKKIAYNISNLGMALRFLNISSKIKKGNLIGQINFIQDKKKNILSDGTILIKSFSVGMVPFSSGKISFTGKNSDFNIMSVQLKGNVVGGSLSGNYKSENQFLCLSGYITPIWSASHLLTSVPILGDFLKSNFAQFFLSSGVKEQDQSAKNNRGAVNIPFTVSGKVNNLEYTFSDELKKHNHTKKIKVEDIPTKESLNPHHDSLYNNDIFGIDLFK